MADLFTEIFNWLPLAHCINQKILVSLEVFTKIQVLSFPVLTLNQVIQYVCNDCNWSYEVALNDTVYLHLFVSVQVMHGGLFKDDNVTLDDLRKIDRNRQPPESGTCYLPRIQSVIWTSSSLQSYPLYVINE